MRSSRWLALAVVILQGLPGTASDKAMGRKARSDYDRALVLLHQKRAQEASVLLDQAISLEPTNPDYLVAREMARQEIATERIAGGERLLGEGNPQNAAVEFREALAIDPQNSFAADRLRDVMAQMAPAGKPSWQLRYKDEPEIALAPSGDSKEFHFRGNTRELVDHVWKAFGINPIIDGSVNSAPVRFEVGPLNFSQAITLLGAMTKSFYVTLSPRQVIVLADTPENRKQYERFGYRAFYFTDASTPQELSDLANLLRAIFDFRLVTMSVEKSMVAVRGPIDSIRMATRVLEDLAAGQPQVMLDVHVFEVDRTFARNLGLALPLQFQLFNFNTAVGSLLQNPSTQSLINQLVSAGGLNQANAAGLAALLAAIGSQGNSVLTQPFAVFGGGITRTGVQIPAATANLSLNESSISTLDHVSLRAQQGNAATFKVGTRYPILNAKFSLAATPSALTQVLGNQVNVAQFPSFTYEDLGLTVKATPQVHGTRDITLKMEFQVRGLGSQSLNGVPVINNREYDGTVTVLNGETAVMAGSISESELRSLQGIPGLVHIPGVRELTSTTNKQTDASEILITISPTIVRASVHEPADTQVFAPASAQ